MTWLVWSMQAWGATWSFGGGGVSFPSDTTACEAFAREIDPSYVMDELEKTATFGTKRCYYRGPNDTPGSSQNYGIVYMVETGGKGPGQVRDDHAVNNMSDAAAAYQSRVCGLPKGKGYYVGDVQFDGYKHGMLCEAKFYEEDGRFVRDPSFRAKKVDEAVKQARRQLAGAGDYPVVWRVPSRPAANVLEHAFAEEGLNVSVVVVP